MSYKSDLQQNNADLQSILDDVNDLPDAFIPTGTKSITENGTHDVKSYASVEVNVASGGGGGGGSVEMCSLTISDPGRRVAVFIYQPALGEFVEIDADPMTPASGTYEVVCGSLFYLGFSGSASTSCNGCKEVYIKLYGITVGAGESATVEVN